MKFSNIYTLFREQTAKYGDAPVFYSRVGDGQGDSWSSMSWREFEDQVHDAACALLAKGLTRGASVAILAGNVPQWTIMDIAAISAGGVGTGIYPTSSPEQCAYIIDHSDAEFVFVDTAAQLEKITDIGTPLPKLKEIICLAETANDSFEAVDNENSTLWKLKTPGVKVPITTYNDFLAFGSAHRDQFLPQIEQIGYSAKPEDTAIMVYTSGTTGDPKGAMLSHAYILNSAESLRGSVPIFDTDVSFSYLPGCHVAERISGIYNRLYNGAGVYFVDDLMKLYSYMLEVKPTVFASLPRFFEKIHAAIVAKHGTDNIEPQVVKDAFGGRVRLLTSGGAPLPFEIAQFFADAGVPILQAYGLTENICVAFNRADDLKFGTVGKPMPMCEVKIAADGEILVKSPMMFSGYYKSPDKTAEMFDTDGWLKTGDLGEQDADGFLKITGRKKEIIVLSTGKNVAPALLENLIKEHHLISHAYVTGDGRSYLTALITLNKDEAETFAKQHDIAYTDFASLTKSREVTQLVDEIVAKTNSRVSSSESIRRYKILEKDFGADEVTPTMKLKRAAVAKNFKNEVDALYA